MDLTGLKFALRCRCSGFGCGLIPSDNLFFGCHPEFGITSDVCGSLVVVVARIWGRFSFIMCFVSAQFQRKPPFEKGGETSFADS